MCLLSWIEYSLNLSAGLHRFKPFPPALSSMLVYRLPNYIIRWESKPQFLANGGKRVKPIPPASSMGESRGGGQGVRTPTPSLKNPKYIGFLSNTSLYPLENHNATKPYIIQGWATINPPVKRHVNGITLAGRWWSAFSGTWILYPLIN